MAANLQGKPSDESYFWVFLFHPADGHRKYGGQEARCEGGVIPYFPHVGSGCIFFFDTPPLQMVGTGAGLIYTRSDIAVRWAEMVRESEDVPLREKEMNEPI